eukprot:GHVT01087923.1.p1 GENE.GHVT01087923.1~~GHVT01087923.1.p1  ORF type:complete len:344 (+),score=4.49 GHVT01087923.1:300-1331(+)
MSGQQGFFGVEADRRSGARVHEDSDVSGNPASEGVRHRRTGTLTGAPAAAYDHSGPNFPDRMPTNIRERPSTTGQSQAAIGPSSTSRSNGPRGGPLFQSSLNGIMAASLPRQTGRMSGFSSSYSGATRGHVSGTGSVIPHPLQRFVDLVIQCISFHGGTLQLDVASAVNLVDECTASADKSRLLLHILADKFKHSSNADTIQLALELVEMCAKNIGVDFVRHVDDSFMRAMANLLKLTTFKRSLARDVKSKINQFISGSSSNPGVATDPRIHKIKRKVLYILQLWHGEQSSIRTPLHVVFMLRIRCSFCHNLPCFMMFRFFFDVPRTPPVNFSSVPEVEKSRR